MAKKPTKNIVWTEPAPKPPPIIIHNNVTRTPVRRTPGGRR